MLPPFYGAAPAETYPSLDSEYDYGYIQSPNTCSAVCGSNAFSATYYSDVLNAGDRVVWGVVTTWVLRRVTGLLQGANRFQPVSDQELTGLKLLALRAGC